MRIAVVTTCKNRRSDLEMSLPAMVEAGFDEVVLVDYGCPQGAGEWAKSTHPSVKVVYHDADSGFSASKARNLGAQAVVADWIFFVDCDILIAPDFVAYLRSRLTECRYYRAEEHGRNERVAYGSFVVLRDDFTRVGGYDEMYRGWGCEDDDVFFRLTSIGTRLSEFPSRFLTELKTAEDKRTEYSPVKIRQVQHAMNHIYLTVKKQVLLLSDFPGELPLETRQAIYNSITKETEQFVSMLDNPNKVISIPFRFSPQNLKTIRPVWGTQEVELSIKIAVK